MDDDWDAAVAVAVVAVEALKARALKTQMDKYPTLGRDARCENGYTLLGVLLRQLLLRTSRGHRIEPDTAVTILDLLLHHGADVNHSLNGETLLLMACRTQMEAIVESILNQDGVDVNAVYQDETALHIACKGGLLQIARALLERNDIQVNWKDEHGRTALDYAQEAGYTKIAKTLAISGADVDTATLDPKVIWRREMLETLKRASYAPQPQSGFTTTDLAVSAPTESSGTNTDHDATARNVVTNRRQSRDTYPNLDPRATSTALDVRNGKVVVKTTTSPSMMTSALRAFVNASQKSAYIVEIQKLEFQAGRAQLFIEYMNGGTLQSRLRDRNFNMAKVAHAMAHALDALHRPGKGGPALVFSYLTPECVLYNNDGDIKLAYFYCCVESTAVTHIGHLERRYVAPEVITSATFTRAADVYAFGVILGQMCPPTHGDSDETTRQLQLAYGQLVEWCTAIEPQDRPSIVKVIDILKNPSVETIDAVKNTHATEYKDHVLLQEMSSLKLKPGT